MRSPDLNLLKQKIGLAPGEEILPPRCARLYLRLLR